MSRRAHDLKLTAIHETGHAVLMVRLGIGCERVTIRADSDSGGATYHDGTCPLTLSCKTSTGSIRQCKLTRVLRLSAASECSWMYR
jgi:hypothetical protein